MEFGEWTSLRLQLLWAYEDTVRSVPVRGSMNRVDFQSVLWMLQGWGETGVDEEQAVRIVPGQMMLTRQGARWHRFSPDNRVLSVGFRAQWPTGEAFYHEGLPVVFDAARHPGLLRLGRRLVGGMARSAKSSYFVSHQPILLSQFLRLKNVFHRLFLELTRALQSHDVHGSMVMYPEQVESSLRLLLDSLPMQPFPTLQSIADRLGISVSQLERRCVLQTGHSVREYLDLRRLTAVTDALRIRGKSIKLIAYEFGFSSPSHFNNWFKHRRGDTPAVFRRLLGW